MKRGIVSLLAVLLLAVLLVGCAPEGMLPKTLQLVEGEAGSLQVEGFQEGDEWQIENDAIAAIVPEGNKVTISGVGIGTTKLTIVREGKTVATCEVRIVLPPISVFLPESGLVLRKNQTVSVKALSGLGLTEAEWESSDESIACVEGQGLLARVTAVKAGNCEITVRSGGYEATFKVQVDG